MFLERIEWNGTCMVKHSTWCGQCAASLQIHFGCGVWCGLVWYDVVVVGNSSRFRGFFTWMWIGSCFSSLTWNVVLWSSWDSASSVRPSTSTCNFFSETTYTISMKLYNNLHHPGCTKVCSWHGKNQARKRSTGVAPPKIGICFLLWNDTHNSNEAWLQTSSSITHDVPKMFTTLKKLLA